MHLHAECTEGGRPNPAWLFKEDVEMELQHRFKKDKKKQSEGRLQG